MPNAGGQGDDARSAETTEVELGAEGSWQLGDEGRELMLVLLMEWEQHLAFSSSTAALGEAVHALPNLGRCAPPRHMGIP